jgi:4-diphosphocytidyl-2-C-methyl-D-erythritol kinase
MSVTVRSFAKINLGLAIGPVRSDRFHELRTLYQTIALHDLVRVEVVRGRGIEIRCPDARVPKGENNTCHRLLEAAIEVLRVRGRVVVEIDKRLPIQGGLGGASGNAVASLLALELCLHRELTHPERLRIASAVGSDLPLFLVGGTVLGVGHGEEVYPVPDLPTVSCVVATPAIGVSTPQAFADWDRMAAPSLRQGAGTGAGNDARGASRRLGIGGRAKMGSPARPGRDPAASNRLEGGKLTLTHPSDRLNGLGCAFSAWLSDSSRRVRAGKALTGVPGFAFRGRAETPLLDLVRAGIENDFEQVVFPKYPELREVKRFLERSGALYASLSGSGSSIYGLFSSRSDAQKAAGRLSRSGTPSVATRTLTRTLYWKKLVVAGF